MNNKAIAIIIVVILVVVGFLVFKDRSVAPTESEVELGMPVLGEEGVEEMIVEEDPTSAETSPATVKEFSLDAFPFDYSLKNITVNRGDTVKITVKNTGGTHDWNVDELTGASTRILQNGESQTITFVADKSGSFEYYCSIGNHRAMGMVGTLTVK